MDAAALLQKQGWRGHGHSLDTTSKGLRKPLLISKKVDVLGVGINKHDVIADQWWMKAFDSSLKDFGTGKKSLLGQVKEHGVKRGGLYGRFVKGEGVPGTIGRVGEKVVVVVEGGEAKGVKRKATGGDEEEKEVKKAKKEKKSSKHTSSSSSSSDDDKAIRRASRKSSSKPPTSTSASTPTSDTPTPSTTTKTKKSRKDKERSLDALPQEKQQQYEARAAEKGLTIQQYFAQRQLKNSEAKQARRSASASAAVTSASEPVSEDEKKNDKKSKKEKRSKK